MHMNVCVCVFIHTYIYAYECVCVCVCMIYKYYSLKYRSAYDLLVPVHVYLFFLNCVPPLPTPSCCIHATCRVRMEKMKWALLVRRCSLRHYS
jgi:hypothetical protein